MVIVLTIVAILLIATIFVLTMAHDMNDSATESDPMALYAPYAVQLREWRLEKDHDEGRLDSEGSNEHR